MAREIRLCVFCEQPVIAIPDATKEWTTKKGDPAQFKHEKTSQNSIPYCGRQFLAEHDTFTETDK